MNPVFLIELPLAFDSIMPDAMENERERNERKKKHIMELIYLTGPSKRVWPAVTASKNIGS